VSTPRVRFDRHELAGAFGDIGTDLPLLVALIATCGLDAASVCIVFGLGQIATGLIYGLPMPVQPLKAMATIMLAGGLSAGTLAGGGLVIGAVMLLLAATGLLDLLARVVPKDVVRGIQVGLGFTLATLALQKYVGAEGSGGYLLAAVAFLALIGLRGRGGVPAPLVVILLGFGWALAFSLDPGALQGAVGLSAPSFRAPTRQELLDGALLLALPQIPLSLGNSVIATSQTTRDLFPDRPVSVRRIGFTYGLMNLIGPWFGGFPVCHGCGGLVGFHNFGARTGGAPVLYGSLYLLLGLFLAPGFGEVVKVFPMPVLGVVLLAEAVALMTLARDVVQDRRSAWLVGLVAAAVVGLPYGYVVGLVAGTVLSHALRRGWVAGP
jgi:MFS superfamily sulfate permease-like transporter